LDNQNSIIMNSKLLYVSATLILLSLSFQFNESEITWMWENKVQVPIILGSISIVLILMHLIQKRRNEVVNN